MTELNSDYFWDIKWSNTPVADNGPFFRQNDFEKYSVTHKKHLLTLYGTSYDEIIKEIRTEPSKNKAPQHNGKNENSPQCSKKDIAPQERTEKYSSLTDVEQQLYLRLYQKYYHRICSCPTPEETTEIKKLGELHAKVVMEQGEVIQHLKENSTNRTYQYIHPEALRYIELFLKEKVDACLTYPRHYSLDHNVEFRPSEKAEDDNGIELLHQQTILELGKVPRLMQFALENPCVLPPDCTKTSARFPVIRNKANCHPSKKPVSKDSIAKSLVVKYEADFVLSSSSLKTLLDNHTPEYHREWELPVTVEECQASAAGGSRKVIFVDKAIARTKMSGRERNYLYHKYALKTQMTHFKPTRGKPLYSNEADKVTASDRSAKRSLSVVNTDLFGDADCDDVDLETFGTSSTSHCTKKLLARAEENVKNVTLKSPASPDPEESRSSEKMCSRTTDVKESTKNVIFESPASPDPEETGSGSCEQMKVVVVNSSFEASSDCDDGNVFQKPSSIVAKEKFKIQTKRAAENTNDSDSDTLVIDFEDSSVPKTPKKESPSARKSRTSKQGSLDSSFDSSHKGSSAVIKETVAVNEENMEKNEIGPVRRSPRLSRATSKSLPKRETKRLGFGTPMVLRSQKSESHIETASEEDEETQKSNDDSVASQMPNDVHTLESNPTEPLSCTEKSSETISKMNETCLTTEKGSLKPLAENKLKTVCNSLPNADSVAENPLDSILQLQKKLLPTSKDSVNVVSRVEGCPSEKYSLYPTPEPKDNAAYSLFTLSKLKLLIRHKIDCVQMPSGHLCSLFPKLEYHPNYGVELSSKSELIRQWASLVLKPQSQLCRVRVDAQTSKVLMAETVDLKNLVEKNKIRFQPELLVKQMSTILESLQELPNGQYILVHKRSEPSVKLYKATEDNKRGAFDLHIMLQQKQMEIRDGLKTSGDSLCWLPIDTETIAPSFLKCHRIPATYPPKVGSAIAGAEKKRQKHKQTKKNAKKPTKKVPFT